jgi:hypothetical protein
MSTTAFPTHPDGNNGMSLRDYFAAKAMQSLIVVYHDDKDLVDEYAQRAFEIADVMLEERK